ncbi:MAG TPA: flagellar motor protein MotB [Planctomycetaceae bacterium]
MAGKGGGAWKVAYADFVTAMMAFFLVMWITAQSKPVKQAVAEYFEDPLGTNDGSRSTSIRGPEDATTVGQFESGRGPGRSLAMANLKSNKPPNPQGVSAVKPPRMVISRDDDHTRSTGTLVSFAADSAELDAAARARLDLLVPLLLGKPNLVEVRGRVAERFGPADADLPDPWQIAYGRCVATMRFLTERGVAAERIRLSQTGAAEPFTVVPDGEAVDQRSCVEVFALSEYARGFDGIHDSRVRRARARAEAE